MSMSEFKKSGVLPVDKEAGITSYDVIRKLKLILPPKTKIGHGGTLDPFATGLLLILIGKGTKLSSSVMGMSKVYQFTAKFGYETDTQDPTGEVVAQIDDLPVIEEDKLSKAAKDMVGEYDQTPPIYSAKKIGGKRAYDLARAGKKVELQSKRVTIHSFDLIEYSWPEVTFRAEVSSGTYVRTLVVDLAKKLDSLATVEQLRRTSIGEYTVDNAIRSDQFSIEDVNSKLIEINHG